MVVEPGVAAVPLARRHTSYECPHGHTVSVPFAELPDVAVPDVWSCMTHSTDCHRVGTTPTSSSSVGRAPRTHWDMLIERRSIPELEALLAEALARVRRERGRT